MTESEKVEVQEVRGQAGRQGGLPQPPHDVCKSGPGKRRRDQGSDGPGAALHPGHDA